MSSSNPPLTQDLPAITDAGSPSGSNTETATSTGSDAPGGGGATFAAGPRPRDPAQPDALAAAAVELARQAAEETAEPNTVGQHLGVSVDDGGLTMHSFASVARGYRGWQWAVTLARVPGFDQVTVCDVVLLPGPDSILAPAWVPWSDRLAPGDLGAGDDLPYRDDDPNLVPGYTVTDPDDADQVLFWELGLGRERVVGLHGLQAAAERWQHGPHGPTSEIAVQASAPCLTCAYFLPLSGFLRQHFGACTNEWSPADGTVVTMDFGCGAHSETDLELPAPEPLPPHILDETVIEHVWVDREEAVADQPEASAEAEPAEAEPAEAEAAETEAETEAEPESPAEPEAVAEALDPVLDVLQPAAEPPEPVTEVLAEAAPESVPDPADFSEPDVELPLESLPEPPFEAVADEPVAEEDPPRT